MNRYELVAIIGVGFVGLILLLERFTQRRWLKYYIRRYKLDLITLTGAVVGYAVSYFLEKQPRAAFIVSIAVTVFATVVIIYSKTRERDFYFLPLQSRSEVEDWLGEGKFEYDRIQEAFVITGSYSGFIFSKALVWSDYRFDFEFKILHASIGAIVRAANLSNMVMLQIFEDHIKAHIRINGLWLAWEPSELKFEERLNLNYWHRCQLDCNKGSIQIRVYQVKTAILDRRWNIPVGPLAFLAESQDKQTRISIPFPINLEFGTIGFRNDAAENAAVKNSLLERL
ncbi:MAG TPA: hypothetical protein VGR47_07230 [Terracidiphilus sp.]|nr:hypothetical protein [Terracidiphilus sp.]